MRTWHLSSGGPPGGGFFLYATLEMNEVAAGRPDLQASEPRILDMAIAEASLCVQLRISDRIREGVVSLEGKWWDRPEESSAVANLLSGSRQTAKGQPTYNDILVQVTPIAP